MNDIDKVSDIQVEDVLEYLRIADASEKLKSEIKVHLKVSKAIVKLRGHFKADEKLDNALDAVGAVFLECARAYDYKNPEHSGGKENPTLKAIYSARQPLAYPEKPSEDNGGE